MKAQPPVNLDPADTKAMIAAFLSDATDQQWDDEAVNNVLEQILQQDVEPGASQKLTHHTKRVFQPVPFHGPDSQPDEEEEGGEADPELEVQEPPPADPYVRERAAGAISTVHTAQGTTTAWISVLDFDGDMSKLHEHEAAANAVANNWLEEQRIRDSMPTWGEVNRSEPPRYGIHTPSRQNKQPGDGDKNADQQYDNKSFWDWTMRISLTVGSKVGKVKVGPPPVK